MIGSRSDETDCWSPHPLWVHGRLEGKILDEYSSEFFTSTGAAYNMREATMFENLNRETGESCCGAGVVTVYQSVERRLPAKSGVSHEGAPRWDRPSRVGIPQ